VDCARRDIPLRTGGFALHVPTPGNRGRDADVGARSDQTRSFERLLGTAVDPYAAGDKRVERHHVVDDQSHLVPTCPHVAELSGVQKGSAGAADPEERFVELEGQRDYVGLSIGAQCGEAREGL